MRNHAPGAVEDVDLTQECDVTSVESAAIFLVTALTPSSDIGVLQAHRDDQEMTDASMIGVTTGAMTDVTDTKQKQSSLPNFIIF